MRKNIITLFEVRKNSKGVYCVPAELMEECLMVNPMIDSMRNEGTVIYAYNRKASEKRNECFVIDTVDDKDLKIIIDYINTGERDFRIRDLGKHGNTLVLDYNSIIIKFISIKEETEESKLKIFSSDVVDNKEYDEDCTDCEHKDLCPNYNGNDDDMDEYDDYKDDDEDIEEEEDCTDCELKDLCPNYNPKNDRSLDEEDCGYRGDGMNDPDNYEFSNKEKNEELVSLEDLIKSFANVLENVLNSLDEEEEEEDREEQIEAEIKEVANDIDELITVARRIKGELKQTKKLKNTGFRFIDYETLDEYIDSKESVQKNIEVKIKELKNKLYELKKEKMEQQKQYRNENHTGYKREKSIINLLFGKDLY